MARLLVATELKMIPVSTLIVDDSPSFLQSALRFLAMDSRIDVIGVALSGPEALEQVEQLHPDLVLMDLAMPGLNGLEATRLLKAGANPPRVVILTLHDTVEYRAAAEEASADGFMAKSDFGVLLLPLIETLRGQGTCFPDAVSTSDAAPSQETSMGNSVRESRTAGTSPLRPLTVAVT